MILDPGQRNCRITLMARAAGQDAIGQPTTVWTDVATVNAKGLSLNGVEAIRGGAPASIATVSWRIRRRSNVSAGMRVRYSGVTYGITSVTPPASNKQYMDIVCEVVDGGV